LSFLISDGIERFVLEKFERVCDDDRIVFYIREYPVFDGGHLVGEEIHIEIVVFMELRLLEVGDHEFNISDAFSTVDQFSV